MEAIVPLLLISLGLAVLDAFASAFGEDSRPGIGDDHTRTSHEGGIE